MKENTCEKPAAMDTGENQALDAKKRLIPRSGTAADLETSEMIFVLGLKPPGRDIKSPPKTQKERDMDYGTDTLSVEPEEEELSDAEKSQIHCDRGDYKIAGGDYQGAIGDLTEAIRLDPQNSLAYNLRGVAYYELGRYEESLADDCVSVDMNPSPVSLFNRAESFYKIGSDGEALDDLACALDLIKEMPHYDHVIPLIDNLADHIRDKSMDRKDYYQPLSRWDEEKMDADLRPEGYDDTGLEVVGFVFESMRVDGEWSVETPGGFSWWGHGLAQRVWAEECRRDHGVDVTLMHVETDFLRNIDFNRQTLEGLNLLNAKAAQSAFVYAAADRCVRLHATTYVHRQNMEWSKRIFMMNAGLQASYAHMRVEEASRLFDGSEPDTSPHPENGYRAKPDEILGVIDLAFIPGNDFADPIEDSEFSIAAEHLTRKSFTTWGEWGLTSEFPFAGDEPAHVRAKQGLGPVTALFQASSGERHPLLGKGLLTTMRLPVSYAREDGLKVAFLLNMLESKEWAKCHMNGAWIIDELNCLSFVSFLPILAHKKQILANLAVSNRIRCGWAAGILKGDHR